MKAEWLSYTCEQDGFSVLWMPHSSCDQISKNVFLCLCAAAPSFSDKMSPIKALTMKDYENVSVLFHLHILCVTSNSNGGGKYIYIYFFNCT